MHKNETLPYSDLTLVHYWAFFLFGVKSRRHEQIRIGLTCNAIISMPRRLMSAYLLGWNYKSCLKSFVFTVQHIANLFSIVVSDVLLHVNGPLQLSHTSWLNQLWWMSDRRTRRLFFLFKYSTISVKKKTCSTSMVFPLTKNNKNTFAFPVHKLCVAMLNK